MEASAYWAQCSHAEILSMHGVELHEVDAALDQPDYDTDVCQENEERVGCCSSGCMDCLGLSWRDFM